MIEYLASIQNRRDEEANIELACSLAQNSDVQGIAEIVAIWQQSNTTIASDCIKVLYEIAERDASLIAPYVDLFIDALNSKVNRQVWGSMTVLSYITPFTAEAVFKRLDDVVLAYKSGSVITIDNSISVFAQLCKADITYQKVVFPILIEHFKKCRAKELLQHSKRIMICLDKNNKDLFADTIAARISEAPKNQQIQLTRIIKKLNSSDY